LFQQSVRANNSGDANRVGYKKKDAVQQLNENTTIEKREKRTEDETIRKLLIHLKRLVQSQRYSEG